MCAKVRKKLFSTIAKEEVIFFAKPKSLHIKKANGYFTIKKTEIKRFC